MGLFSSISKGFSTFAAPLIGAGASLGGAALGASASRDANEATLANAALDRDLQKEFAQKGIRWRVEDAQAAGIHPLYSLGASIPGYNPSAIRLDSSSSWGKGLHQAGQDISRSIDSTRTRSERLSSRSHALSLERGELENQLLRVQIAKLNASQTGPPLPSAVPGATSALPGSGDIPSVSPYEVKRVQIPAVQRSKRHQSAGAFPETRWARTRTGFSPVPDREAYEDADIGNPSAWPWYWRNQILPSLGVSGDPPPDNWLPMGASGWEWFPSRGEWQPRYKKGWHMHATTKGSSKYVSKKEKYSPRSRLFDAPW